MAKPVAIFFDLDGTLVDSAIDISLALASAFTKLGLAAHKEAKVRTWIGNGIDKLLHRALTDSFDGIADDESFQKLRSVFFVEYERQSGYESTLYSNVETVLKTLSTKKIPMVCITNKNRCFTIPLLEKLGIAEYFQLIIGGDDVTNKKPHPESLNYAANYLKVDKNKCLMIGDSKNDVLAANQAGVDIICVDYGYAQGENLEELNIKSLISDFSEILTSF